MNKLAGEKSPYLLQHAANPVDWLPWGEEAFAKARAENKPIFLSIGYSTCHWCHVMAHESFEDPAVAAIMNREFVNIKVDREERPDVDRVYMTFVQATTGGGGWPMSVWLTPELKPFVGGTYFPPEDRYGHPAFSKVLERIAGAWRENGVQIAEQGAKIVAALSEAAASSPGGAGLTDSVIEAAYQHFARSHDAHEGGFGAAPKFPRPSVFNFLFRYYARSPESDSGRHALAMNLFTLRKMAAGGIHDHLGGGFARYSVDTYWHVPHFEKMLYDQAQLAVAYVEAFQITREPIFENVARDILDYVRRDMTSPDGGFYSAEDADSLFEHGKPEHGEGAFYVWSEREIDEALGDDAALFKFHYGVEPGGNAPAGSDPHNEFRGRNILIERHSIAETAAQFARSESAVNEALARAGAVLFEIRETRPRPHLDDKILSAWNGLMISAFARAAQVFDDVGYAAAATRAATFIRERLYDGERKILRRSYREGPGAVEGFAEDYAFVIQGLLDLHATDFDGRWIEFADELQATQDRLFLDETGGGYFSVSGNDSSILLRMKEDNDGAEPAASSIAAMNLLRLSQLRNEPAYRERAEQTVNAFAPQISRFPSMMPQMLATFALLQSKPRQIVIAGDPAAPETRALLAEARRRFLPDAVVMLADSASPNPAVAAMKPVGGKAAAYVCENFTCRAPVTDPAELRALLAR